MSRDNLKEIIQEAKPVAQANRVLAVDDEETNLDILQKYLSKAGYQTVCLKDGAEAWNFLKLHGHSVDIIVLDKMMPKMDGFEVLQRIQSAPELRFKPVIIQTAAVGKEDAVKGIELGAYYYITKPYDAEVLISVVNAAARDYIQQQKIDLDLQRADAARALIVSGTFELRSPKEARSVAAYLAGLTDSPARKVVGILALISNAVEHGNLEIGYEKKADLLATKTLEMEMDRRLCDPLYKDRKVRVTFTRSKQQVKIHIKDDGAGFRWREYVDFDPRRMADPNGRGIAMANIIAPGGLKYIGDGNELEYVIRFSG